MKVYKYILYLLFFLTACSESKIEDMYSPSGDPHYMIIENKVLDLTSHSSTENIHMLTTEEWQVCNTSAWLKLPTTSGIGDSFISVEIEENKSGDNERLSILEVNSLTEYKFQDFINISQAKAKAYIELQKSEIIIPGIDTTLNINVDATVEWEVEDITEEVSGQSASRPQISIYKINNESVKVSFSQNLSIQHTYSYTLSFYSIKNRNLRKELKILQNPATIVAETDTLLFPQSGAAYKLKIASEAEWYASSEQDWIEISPNVGDAGSSEINIVALPNWNAVERDGVVNFSFGHGTVLALNVSQEEVIIEADPNDIEFAAYGSSETFEITSNIDWEILSHPNWINFSINEGSSDAIITATASNNSDTLSRTGEIVIGQDGLSHKAIIKVYQDGKFFNHHMSDLTLSSCEQKFDIEFSTNDLWTISTYFASKWVSFNHTEGKGQIYIEGKVEDNPSVNHRSDTIIVKPQDLKKSVLNIAINQKPRYLEISHNGILFFDKGGRSDIIDISTDGKIKVIKENGDWFDVIFNSDSTSFEIIAQESEVYSREGRIKFSLSDLEEGTLELEVTVRQCQPGGHFNIYNYTDDELWDPSYNSSLGINIFGYDDDVDMDSGTLGISLDIIGFGDDINWNGKPGGLTLTITGFREDNNYDKNNNSGNINIGNYGDENDWNNDEK